MSESQYTGPPLRPACRLPQPGRKNYPWRPYEKLLAHSGGCPLPSPIWLCANFQTRIRSHGDRLHRHTSFQLGGGGRMALADDGLPSAPFLIKTGVRGPRALGCGAWRAKYPGRAMGHPVAGCRGKRLFRVEMFSRCPMVSSRDGTLLGYPRPSHHGTAVWGNMLPALQLYPPARLTSGPGGFLCFPNRRVPGLL